MARRKIVFVIVEGASDETALGVALTQIFDKDSDWTIKDWARSDARIIMNTCPYTYSNFINESDMTDEEKENHPEYETIGGYIKTFIVTEEDKEKWWNELDEDKKDVIKALPNFDFDKFRQCVGF